MICSTTSLQDLCIFLLGLKLLLLENGCPNVFDHSSHEKRQAEPDNQQLFTPSQPKHLSNICHRTPLSSRQNGRSAMQHVHPACVSYRLEAYATFAGH